MEAMETMEVEIVVETREGLETREEVEMEAADMEELEVQIEDCDKVSFPYNSIHI